MREKREKFFDNSRELFGVNRSEGEELNL